MRFFSPTRKASFGWILKIQNAKEFLFLPKEMLRIFCNKETFFFEILKVPLNNSPSCVLCSACWFRMHGQLHKRMSSAVCFAFGQENGELFHQTKTRCRGWKPKLIKMNFEIALMNGCKLEFPDVTIYVCNFHYNQCLWRKTQDLGLVNDYKTNEDIKKNVCWMYSAPAYLPLEHFDIDDAWNFIWEKAWDNDKLLQFIDCLVEQRMDNLSITIQVSTISSEALSVLTWIIH